MKTIYLHIGSEKTGTTAIQKLLDTYAPQLAEQGLLYPQSGRLNRAHFALVEPVFFAATGRHLEFIKDPELCTMSLWDNLLDEVSRFSGNTIVISAEHFSSRLDTAAVEVVGRKLAEFPDIRCKVVFYARRQDKLLESAFSTSVRSGSPAPLDNYLERAMRHDRYFDYGKMLRPWAELFGNDAILLRPFDSQIIKSGLIEDFFETIGLGYVDLTPYKVGRENESLHPVTVMAGSYLNSRMEGRDFFYKSKLINALNRKIEADAQYAKYRSLGLLPSKTRRMVVKEYELSNIRLFNTYNAPRHLSDPLPPYENDDSVYDIDLREIFANLWLAEYESAHSA